MTLEMRDRENREKGRIYGIISACRECNISEERILEMLQEKEGLSEKSAIVYLEEAEEALKRVSKYTAFMDKLCKIISDLKKINVSDDTIIVKIQDEFHFTNDDAEFYYEYAMKRKDFTGKSGETAQSAKKDGERRHEYMTLEMIKQENRDIGKAEGLEIGISGMVSSLRDFNIPDPDILQKIQEKYNLSQEEAERYMKTSV